MIKIQMAIAIMMMRRILLAMKDYICQVTKTLFQQHTNGDIF